MIDFFDQLGTLVQERWRGKHFDDACFTEIATDALRELPPAGAVGLAELVRWAVTTDHFVAQKPVEGAPYTPLCVYHNELFFARLSKPRGPVLQKKRVERAVRVPRRVLPRGGSAHFFARLITANPHCSKEGEAETNSHP